MIGMLPMPKVNLAEREFFQAHRAGADLVIGRTIRTQASGRLSFTVSKRVAGPGDRFAGVVAAVTPLSYFAGLYDSLNLGPDGTIGLVRDDGAVVARHPWRDEYLESSVASSDLFRMQLPKAASGSYRALSPVDGVEMTLRYALGASTAMLQLLNAAMCRSLVGGCRAKNQITAPTLIITATYDICDTLPAAPRPLGRPSHLPAVRRTITAT